jgi:serine/threonine protein kinase
VGIVHRDLKPSNVILASDGARVIDFGVVQAADGTSITTTGQHMGSAALISCDPVGREGGRRGASRLLIRSTERNRA